MNAIRLLTNNYSSLLKAYVSSVDGGNVYITVDDDASDLGDYTEYLIDTDKIEQLSDYGYEVLCVLDSRVSDDSLNEGKFSIVSIDDDNAVHFFSYMADQTNFFSIFRSKKPKDEIVSIFKNMSLPFSRTVSSIDLSEYEKCFTPFVTADGDNDGMNEQSFLCSFDDKDTMMLFSNKLLRKGYTEVEGRNKNKSGFEYTSEVGEFYFCDLAEEIQLLKG